MSHFMVVVFTKASTDVEAEIARVMAPYCEDGEWDREGSFWDWYVIGGRYDGVMTGAKQVIIREPCWLCGGTGRRAEPPNSGPGNLPCNGCNSTGTEKRLPRTVEEAGDALGRNSCKPEAMLAEFVPFAFLTPDGTHYTQGRMGWWATVTDAEEEATWAQKWAETKGAFADYTAVLLDCHV